MSGVRQLHYIEARRRISELAAILVDCVAGGASVGFMDGFSQANAERFYARVADGVGAGDRLLYAAIVDGKTMGTVQLLTAMMPNQPHRAEISKMLVHRAARERGLGRALLVAAEEGARGLGKTLLTLDTASAEAERLYTAIGYQTSGEIPGFALLPNGSLCATILMWKKL